MSNRNKKPHRPAPTTIPAARPTTPREGGLKAFRSGNFTEAIRLWTSLEHTQDARLRSAIAEAYYRRALAPDTASASSIADLKQAMEMAPNDERYPYQLALALHRANHLREALQAYARAAELNCPQPGLSYARALAAIELNPRTKLDTLSWVTAEDRKNLEPILALMNGKPQAIPPDNDAAPGSPQATLWYPLSLLAKGDAGGAQSAFASSQANRQKLPSDAETARSYYHGVAEALCGNQQAAQALWKEALRRLPSSSGQYRSRMSMAVAQASSQNITALLHAGQWKAALNEIAPALKAVPADPWLLGASVTALNGLATAAYKAENCSDAVNYWHEAYEMLTGHPELGPIAPIVHNIALAYEAIEEWEDAAGAWNTLREITQRRIKRGTKKSTPSSDEIAAKAQLAWLRRRIIKSYKHAELPEEAIALYRQAVKANPNDLEVRLELASALLANEQVIAARNEANRVIAADPRNVDARLFLAEIHMERNEADAALKVLREALEIAPANEMARQALSSQLMQLGMDAFNYGQFQQAVKYHTEALALTPNQVDLLVFLGEAEISLGQVKQGEAHVAAALESGSLDGYLAVFRHFLRHGKLSEGRKILEQGENAGIPRSEMYQEAILYCFLAGISHEPFGSTSDSLRPQDRQARDTFGREMVQALLDASANKADMLDSLIDAIGPRRPAISVEYANQLIALQPDVADHHIMVALIHTLSSNNKEARASLAQAERIARRNRQDELLHRITLFRNELNSPLFGLL